MYGSGVIAGRRAGSGVGKYCILDTVDSIVYNAKSPKQGSKRFNSITKTTHFADLGTIFIYGDGLFLSF